MFHELVLPVDAPCDRAMSVSKSGISRSCVHGFMFMSFVRSCVHVHVHVQVAQHGIRAILPGSSQQDVSEPLGDISGGDATWKAWKLVELHTAQVRHAVL